MLLMSLPGSPATDSLPASDKVQHAAVFGAFAVLIAMALQRPARPLNVSQAFSAVFITTAFGVLTELKQHFFVPSRFGAVEDVVADLLGAMAAVSIYYVVARKWPRISLILGD